MGGVNRRVRRSPDDDAWPDAEASDRGHHMLRVLRVFLLPLPRHARLSDDGLPERVALSAEPAGRAHPSAPRPHALLNLLKLPPTPTGEPPHAGEARDRGGAPRRIPGVARLRHRATEPTRYLMPPWGLETNSMGSYFAGEADSLEHSSAVQGANSSGLDAAEDCQRLLLMCKGVQDLIQVATTCEEMACFYIALFVVQFVASVVLCLGCFWIKIRRFAVLFVAHGGRGRSSPQRTTVRCTPTEASPGGGDPGQRRGA